MTTITMQITLGDAGDGDVSINVVTVPFTPSEIPDEVGTCWVGICNAVNEYIRRSTGAPDFDCMRMRTQQ